MRTFAYAQLVALVLACGGLVAAAHSNPRCGSEDGPTWTWSRCGNHKRGVTTASGRRAIVGPCRYATLALNGNLGDSPAMRGDHWAIAHGCPHGVPNEYAR